jgi:hypothetical protein
VVSAVRAFAPRRQADLRSGVGLAATLHALTGPSVRDAAVLADDVPVGDSDEAAGPDHEVRREQVRARLRVSAARST